MSGAVNEKPPPQRESNRSTLMTDIYTLSYLIIFSCFGTIGRLVLEALIFYLAAPATTSELWANFAGSLMTGLLSEDYALFRNDAGQSVVVSTSDESGTSWKADAAKYKKTIICILG